MILNQGGMMVQGFCIVTSQQEGSVQVAQGLLEFECSPWVYEGSIKLELIIDFQNIKLKSLSWTSAAMWLNIQKA